MLHYLGEGMTFWLKTQGFVYKEPIKVQGKLDPEKQEAFIKAYGALKASLKEDEELFLWMLYIRNFSLRQFVSG